MKLRNKLLALSLLTLLLPWSGWKLLQELEHFLREGQESTLQASTRTVALTLPDRFRTNAFYGRSRSLPSRAMSYPPNLDGYSDDWLAPGDGLAFSSADGALEMHLIAGLGRELERAALKAGYGSTISPKSLEKLVTAISDYQVESLETIAKLRKESEANAKEIRRVVEAPLKHTHG